MSIKVCIVCKNNKSVNEYYDNYNTCKQCHNNISNLKRLIKWKNDMNLQIDENQTDCKKLIDSDLYKIDDIYKKFFDEKIVLLKDTNILNKSTLSLVSLHNIFKTWYKQKFTGKPPKSDNFNSAMCKS